MWSVRVGGRRSGSGAAGCGGGFGRVRSTGGVREEEAAGAGCGGAVGGFLVYPGVRERESCRKCGAGARSQHSRKKGWAHPPLPSPKKRGEEERGAPTQNRHSHRNSEEKANEEEQPASTPPHGGGQHMSRKAPYRPESGSTKVSANASMKASRPCSAPRKGWPGYLNRKRSYQETYPVKTLCGRYHRPKPKRETGRTSFHYSPSPNESPAPLVCSTQPQSGEVGE